MFFFKKNIDTNTSDELLMSHILKGNKFAFELLYERYFSKLVWYVNGYVNDSALAEDIIQDVFIKIIHSPEKFNADYKFSTWVYNVAGNLAKNSIRDEKKKQEKLMIHSARKGNESNKINSNLDVKFLENKLNEIFISLNEKEKMIFQLRFEEKLSIKEISLQLNIPEGSVKSGIFYLLKKYNHLIKHFSNEK